MNRTRTAVIAVVIVFLGLFLVFPLWDTLVQSCWTEEDGFTLFYYAQFWRDAAVRQAILNSLLIGVSVTVLTAVIALPLSLFSARYDFPGKGILTSLLLVPMIMPPFVGAVGVYRALARHGMLNQALLALQGFINTHTGLGLQIIDPKNQIFWRESFPLLWVIILEVLHLYPIMYLNFTAALANIDPAMEEAAVNMGSKGFRLFRKITLPLMMPGLFAGSVIVFIWALTDLGTPLIFNYQKVIPMVIWKHVQNRQPSPVGPALVIGLLMLTALLYLASKKLFGQRTYETLSKGTMGARTRRVSGPASAGIIGFMLLVIVLAALPHIMVVVTSFSGMWDETILPSSYTIEHYQSVLAGPRSARSWGALRNSVLYSTMSTMLDLGLGVLIAYILVRARFKGAALLDALVMLPLAIPGIVLAFGYLRAFEGTPIDAFKNPVTLLVIAYAVRRLPYMVRAAYAGFQQVSVQLEEAAINLGSPPLKAVRRITVPLVSANLIGGGILVFAFAMLEVSNSLILSFQQKYDPLTKAIWRLTESQQPGSMNEASALGVCAMLFLATALVLAGMMMGKRMGQLFRV